MSFCTTVLGTRDFVAKGGWGSGGVCPTGGFVDVGARKLGEEGRGRGGERTQGCWYVGLIGLIGLIGLDF